MAFFNTYILYISLLRAKIINFFALINFNCKTASSVPHQQTRMEKLTKMFSN
jgi:hypothetical protein